MTEQEYLRDSNYRDTPDVAADILAEHEKISSADAIVFIYPVFWTEAPAKLVGWFDSTSRENPLREQNWDKNLAVAYEKGRTLF